MKKIIRLTEGDINRIVKRVLSEQNSILSQELEGTPLEGCKNLTNKNIEKFCMDFIIHKDKRNIKFVEKVLNAVNKSTDNKVTICDICDKSKTNLNNEKEEFNNYI